MISMYIYIYTHLYFLHIFTYFYVYVNIDLLKAEAPKGISLTSAVRYERNSAVPAAPLLSGSIASCYPPPSPGRAVKKSLGVT